MVLMVLVQTNANYFAWFSLYKLILRTFEYTESDSVSVGIQTRRFHWIWQSDSVIQNMYIEYETHIIVIEWFRLFSVYPGPSMQMVVQ